VAMTTAVSFGASASLNGQCSLFSALDHLGLLLLIFLALTLCTFLYTFDTFICNVKRKFFVIYSHHDILRGNIVIFTIERPFADCFV
jgi:hypothetical protein